MASLLNAVSSLMTSKEEESFVKGGAEPFVKIVDGKLSFVNRIRINTKKPFRVLSILGKARMGKSTLFNTIISKLTKKNQKIFQTQDNDEHCTRGINGYFLKDHDLLLLDCQGLSLENSSHDPTLLLLVYLISDVIVFNERMMLQNEALKLMEPICTFMTYIDTDTVKKPTLVFRISDADLVKDTQHNLNKVLSPYEDQYQSIRESITHLFQDPIELVKTNPLERSHKQFLEKNDYMSLLKDDFVAFNDAVSKIVSFLGNGQNPEEWIQKVPIIIEQINNNEKINYKKLDIVGLTQKNEVQEWILSLPNTPFTPIAVDHTQKMYEDNVEPRKAEKKNILTNFTKKFKNLPKSIKEAPCVNLEERLNAPIKIAGLKAESDAHAFLKCRWVPAAYNIPFCEVNSLEQSFTSRNDEFWNYYFKNQDQLVFACKNNDIYAPVAKQYIDWVNEIKAFFFAEINKFKLEEAKEVETIDTKLNTLIESYIDSKLTMIEETKEVEFLKKTTTSYIEEWKKECINSITTTIKTMTKNRSINSSFIPNNGKQAIKLTTLQSSIEHTINYDLIKPLYEKYKLVVENEFNDYFLEAIKEKKIGLLENKVIMNTISNGILIFHPIILANPDMEWIADFHKGTQLGCFITKDTYLKNIGPIHQKIATKMIKKGYISDSYKFKMAKYTGFDIGFDILKKYNMNNVYNTYENSFYNIAEDVLLYNNEKIRHYISILYNNYYSKEFLLANKETMFEDVDTAKVEIVIPELVLNDVPKTRTIPFTYAVKIASGKIKNENINKIDELEDKRLEKIAHSWAYDS